MMPNRPVTVRRWEVVGAFLLLVAVAIGISLWNDFRIDAAEKRISRNAASIKQIEEVNQTQSELRAQLVRDRKRSDFRLCREVEGIKDRIRASVKFNEQRFNDTLESLGITLGSPQAQALIKSARESEAELRGRFAPLNCRVVTEQ